MEYEFKVEQHSYGSNFYVIEYRKKKQINWFNEWKRLTQTYDGFPIDRNHPVMETYEQAVKIAKDFKANPSLLHEWIKKEDEKYHKLVERDRKEAESRYKPKVII